MSPRIAESEWPKITVVTPSFNQGRWVEQTMRSVLDQMYPSVEYIVMDGGSTDESVSHIKRYEDRLAYWQTRKDGGQAAAIANGFARGSGDIFAWLNSDDYLLPGALRRVGEFFAENPDAEWVVAGGLVVDASGRLLRKYYMLQQDFDSLLSGGQLFMQMSTFWRRRAYERVGGLDASLRFCFDYDLFLRLARESHPRGIDALTSAFRVHGGSKTSTIWNSVALPEIEQVRRRYGFESLTLAERQATHQATIAEFYRVTRIGIMRDAYRDPRYFARCMLNKLRGRPGSPLIGGAT